jgi:hypothetical protein
MVAPNDVIAYGRVAWSAILGAWKFFRRNARTLTAQQKLELRNKWKPQFSNYLADQHSKDLRTDVIIRDMKRMDVYPNVDKGKGISAWFRVGLADTYERGIMVGLGWEGLMEEPEGFRYADWSKGELGKERKVLLTGYIPYENIESVDWDGDSIYGFPHIYCYFTFKGEPYEKMMFCERRELNGWPFLIEVVDYASVRKRSKKSGIVR